MRGSFSRVEYYQSAKAEQFLQIRSYESGIFTTSCYCFYALIQSGINRGMFRLRGRGCEKPIPEILHQTILRRQIKELQQETQPVDDLGGAHSEYPAEVHHGLADGEFAVESNFLWHVADPFSRHSGSLCPGFAAQHPDLP